MAISEAYETIRNGLLDYDNVSRLEKLVQVLFVTLLGIAIIIPFSLIILQALSDTPITHTAFGELSLSMENFSLVTEPVFQEVLTNTILYVIGTVTLAHIVGFIFAYILTRWEIPFANVFHILLFLPIFLSPLILALGYGFAFSTGGWFYAILDRFMEPFAITTIWGLIFVGAFELTPFAYSFISAGLQNIDPDMEDAARLTGANNSNVVRVITVPLLKPFLLSSLFLTVLLSIQAISVPAILGLQQGTYVLATYIIALEGLTVPPPYGVMAAIGVILIVMTLIVVVGMKKIIGDLSKYTVITGQSRSRTLDTPRHKQVFGVSLLVGYIGILVVIPLAQILFVGLTSAGTIAGSTINELSLVWIWEVLDNTTTTRAIRNSVIIAIATASATVLLTGMMSYIVNRTDSRIGTAIDMLTWIPIATPGVVLGLAYLWSVLIFPIGLYGTIWVLMIAFFVRYSALGMRMNTSLLAQQSVEIDEQAKVVGTTMFGRLRNIIFPNAKTGMLSVWVLLYVLFMNELATSLFLYADASRVITVTIFEYWFTSQFGMLAALAMVQVTITLSLIVFLMKFFDVEISAM